jgi:plastocyanin
MLVQKTGSRGTTYRQPVKKLLPLLVAVTFVAAGCGSSNKSSENESTNTTTGTSGGGGSVVKTFTISETEFKLTPSTVKLDQPGTYVFKAKNDGSIDHALEIEGQGLEEETETIGPGESADLRVTITKPGSYEMYCPIDNHREQGMEATLALGKVSPGMTTDETKTETGEGSGGPGGGY